MSRYVALPHLGEIRWPAAAAKFVTPLAIVGGLYLAVRLRSVISFTWTHLIRRGSLKCYKDEKGNTWALVTGASDGIGKGFAEELADQGFDVILHGRNEAKLKGVQSDLERRWPQRSFRLLIIDAEAESNSTAKMEAEVAKITSLNIRILVNNVAGGGAHEKPIFKALSERVAENVNGWIDISTKFPTQITRLLLPTLISKQPALILNIGSGISEFGVPYLTTYSGCKAYNKAWSRALAAEMIADGHDIQVIAIVVGEVATEKLKRQVGLARPSPRQMAKSSLHAVGSGKRIISAYWFHAIQLILVSYLPESFADKYAIDTIKKLKQEEKFELEGK